MATMLSATQSPPITINEGFRAVGYRQAFSAVPARLYAQLEAVPTPPPANLKDRIDLQAAGEPCVRTQTQASAVRTWLPQALEEPLLEAAVAAFPELAGLERLAWKLVERGPSRPWEGYQVPHRDLGLLLRWSVDARTLMVPLDYADAAHSLQIAPGTQHGYHAENLWHVVLQPPRSMLLLGGTTIHRGAGGPGRFIFCAFIPKGKRARMVTVEPENIPDLMWSTPTMPPAHQMELSARTQGEARPAAAPPC